MISLALSTGLKGVDLDKEYTVWYTLAGDEMTTDEKIMKKALEAFANKGYENIGVQEICDISGITKPTLYHYFGSKPGLLTQIMTEYSKRLVKTISNASDYHGDLPLTINKTVKAYFEFARSNKSFYRLLLNLFFAPPESPFAKICIQYMKEQFLILEKLFKRASGDHGNMKHKEKRNAITLLGFINSYIGMWMNGEVELNDDHVFSASHQFMHGIYS
ncbi:MAG: TetR/AcrR family transcriptional regulator [Thermotogota bacterium]